MSVEVLNSTLETNSILVEEMAMTASAKGNTKDARRRLEDKIEEIRLRRETQEYDFDI